MDLIVDVLFLSGMGLIAFGLMLELYWAVKGPEITKPRRRLLVTVVLLTVALTLAVMVMQTALWLNTLL